MVSPEEAISRLREGNRRFAAGAPSAAGPPDPARRAELARAQRPWAIVLGCSDSRVPVEQIFDQGPGGIFVVRVAGNVAGPFQVGSIELAVEHFGTRLVVVLGHSHCGAVALALDDLEGRAEAMSADLRSIVGLVRPSLKGLFTPGTPYDRETVLARGVRANIMTSVHRLREGSDVLRRREADAGVLVTGAEYCIETGIVDFID